PLADIVRWLLHAPTQACCGVVSNGCFDVSAPRVIRRSLEEGDGVDYAGGARRAQRGGIMPIHGRLRGLPIGLAPPFPTPPPPAAALAADPDAFLAGTTKICAGCDLAARDLKERDLKRAKLDRAKLRNADLTGASLFRASLVRADLIGAKLKDANLNLVDAKWADLTGADLRDALLYEADLASANLSLANLQCARPRRS